MFKIKLNFRIFVILIIGIINILFQQLPLLNSIGYEISAVNGLLIFISAGLISINAERNNNKNKIIIYYSILFFLPFLISFFSTAFFSLCPIRNELLFYPLIVFPSLLLGAGIGKTSFLIGNKFAYLIFSIIVLLFAIVPVFDIYEFPQVYFYNTMIGFFPGVIYDDWIPLTEKLVLFRLMVFTTAVFILLVNSKNILPNRLKIVLALIILAVFFTVKYSGGFVTTDKMIAEYSSNIVETEHFKIFFPPELNDREKKYSVLNHEYYYGKLSKLLKAHPEKKIKSYVFLNSLIKKKLFGAERADVAKPWQNSIYTEAGTSSNTIMHELVHIFSAKYAGGVFNLPDYFNPAMIEGYAMAAVNEYDGHSLHYMAKLAKVNNYYFPVSELFTGLNFMSRNSSLSYILSGSFIKYLEDEYGIDKVNYVYNSLDFKKVFGEDINSLEIKYDKFLDTLPADSSKSAAEFYFGRLPVYKQFCVRFTAQQTREAWDYFNNKEYNSALKEFNEIYSKTNSYSALIGSIYSYSKLENDSSALNVAINNIQNFKGSSYFFPLQLITANLYIRNKEFVKAVEILKQTEAENLRTDYYNRAVTALNIIAIGDSAIYNYIKGDKSVKLEILDKLNEREFVPESMQYYFEFADSNYSNEKLFEIAKQLSAVGDCSNYKASFIAAEYFLETGDYSKAEFFTTRPLENNCDKFFLKVFQELSYKIGWFKTYSMKYNRMIK